MSFRYKIDPNRPKQRDLPLQAYAHDCLELVELLKEAYDRPDRVITAALLAPVWPPEPWRAIVSLSPNEAPARYAYIVCDQDVLTLDDLKGRTVAIDRNRYVVLGVNHRSVARRTLKKGEQMRFLMVPAAR